MFCKIFSRCSVVAVILFILLTFYGCTSAVTLKLLSVPDKTTYFLGEKLDLKGGKLQLFFADGDVEVLMTDPKITVSGYNPDKEGTQEVTVSYPFSDKVYSASFQVSLSVHPDPACRIEIDSPPNKTYYVEGQKFDKTGLVVFLVRESGRKTLLEDYELLVGETVTMDDNGVVEVRYGKFKDTFYITVVKREITEIVFVEKPTKTEYKSGDAPSLDGAQIAYVFNDGSIENVSVDTKINVYPNVLRFGVNEIKVTVDGLPEDKFPLSFAVTVTKKSTIVDATAEIAQHLNAISLDSEAQEAYLNAYISVPIFKTDTLSLDGAETPTIPSPKITLGTIANFKLNAYRYTEDENGDGATLKIHIYALMAAGKSQVVIETAENVVTVRVAETSHKPYTEENGVAYFAMEGAEVAILTILTKNGLDYNADSVTPFVLEGMCSVNLGDKQNPVLWWNFTLAEKMDAALLRIMPSKFIIDFLSGTRTFLP